MTSGMIYDLVQVAPRKATIHKQCRTVRVVLILNGTI
jgi:hypothetical protein